MKVVSSNWDASMASVTDDKHQTATIASHETGRCRLEETLGFNSRGGIDASLASMEAEDAARDLGRRPAIGSEEGN